MRFVLPQRQSPRSSSRQAQPDPSKSADGYKPSPAPEVCHSAKEFNRLKESSEVRQAALERVIQYREEKAGTEVQHEHETEEFKQEMIQLKAALALERELAKAHRAAAQSQEEELKQEILFGQCQIRHLKASVDDERERAMQLPELEQEILNLKASAADERERAMANEAAAQSREEELKQEILRLKASAADEKERAMADNVKAAVQSCQEKKQEIIRLASVADARDKAVANLAAAQAHEEELKQEIIRLNSLWVDERDRVMANQLAAQAHEEELKQEIIRLKAAVADERDKVMANKAAAQSHEEELKQEILNLKAVATDRAGAQSQEDAATIKEQQSCIAAMEVKLNMSRDQVSELERQLASWNATARDLENRISVADTTHAGAIEERDQRISELETLLRDADQCTLEKQNAYDKWLKASEDARKAADLRIESLEKELQKGCLKSTKSMPDMEILILDTDKAAGA